MQMKPVSVGLVVLLFLASPAFAHVGVDHSESFRSGFSHPLGGVDHVLAMVAVGLYAASLGGSSVWLVPAAFIGTMVAGGVLGFAGTQLPWVEQGIALSVVVVGFAVASGAKLPTAMAMTLVALFAVFHGHAHGREAAEFASFLPYAVGFVIATGLLHAMGVALAWRFARFGDVQAAMLQRSTGAATAAAGVAFIAGWLAA